MTFEDQVKEAKQRVKIADVWKALNYPGEPRNPGRSPWREDKSPSFCVFSNGMLFKDHMTGESGDVIIFLEKSCSITRKDAMHRIVKMAFGESANLWQADRLPEMEKEVPLANARKKPLFPEMVLGADYQLEQLSKLRGIRMEALLAAQKAGALRFGLVKGCSSWIVTDDVRINGQARRLNGDLWQLNIKGELMTPKSYTLPGSAASWPLGIGRSSKGKTIYMTEGGPDYLAAFTFASNEIIPVGMLGAGQLIPAGALPLFWKTEVLMFMHNEKPKPRNHKGVIVTPEFSAGEEAALRWMKQLEPFTKKVKIYPFPDGIKDLNDYVKAHDQLKF